MKSALRATARRLGVVMACASAGCVENGVGAPARGPNPAAVSATLAVDLRNPDEAREHVFGDAVLFSRPGVGLALALDGGPAPGMQDGYVDQVFVLQQREPITLGIRHLESAELFFGGRLLLVRAQGAAPLALMVQGRDDPSSTTDRPPFSTAGAEHFVGFGISRRTGAWRVPLEEVTGGAVTSLLPVCASAPDGRVGAASTCDSGGEGSTSCSTSCATVSGGACSTSCGSGYYSCCDRGACTCTCIESGGGANPKPPINMTSVPPGRGQP